MQLLNYRDSVEIEKLTPGIPLIYEETTILEAVIDVLKSAETASLVLGSEVCQRLTIAMFYPLVLLVTVYSLRHARNRSQQCVNGLNSLEMIKFKNARARTMFMRYSKYLCKLLLY